RPCRPKSPGNQLLPRTLASPVPKLVRVAKPDPVIGPKLADAPGFSEERRPTLEARLSPISVIGPIENGPVAVRAMPRYPVFFARTLPTLKPEPVDVAANPAMP